MLERLTAAGQGDAESAQVPTNPVQPGQLASALGQTTICERARHAGMSEQESVAQLSRVLSGVVDKLTPDGRVPDQAEIESHFRTQPLEQ
jgi:uncharacterized protein YidB (DUF937 family)